VRGELEGHGLGETEHGKLARDVVGEEGDPSLLGRHRRGIDDPSRFVRAIMALAADWPQ